MRSERREEEALPTGDTPDYIYYSASERKDGELYGGGVILCGWGFWSCCTLG